MWRCAGGEPAGERSRSNSGRHAGLPRRQALARCKRIIARFEDEHAYRSLVSPMWKTRYGDYDHLARVKEWSAGGEDEEVRMTAIPPTSSTCSARSDPALSAWVAANAGSGKTHVLAQRVIRCCCAARRRKRSSASPTPRPPPPTWRTGCSTTLAKWTALDDASARREIEKIEGRRPERRRALHARRLFAQALDTPGG
jgi:hypothetical protein